MRHTIALSWAVVLLWMTAGLGCSKGPNEPPANKPAVAPGPAQKGAPFGLKPGQEIEIPLNRAGKVLSDLHAGKPLDPKLLTKNPGGLPPANAAAVKPAGPAGKGAALQPDAQVAAVSRQKLTHFYQLLTGKPVRPLEMRPDNGMWRFVFDLELGGKRRKHVVYTTLDGKRFFEGSGAQLDGALAEVKGEKAFVACLAAKQVRVFGDPKAPTTLQQLKELGRFAPALLIDCTKHTENCQKSGVKQLPTVALGKQMTTPGVRKRVFFERATGCK